MEQRILFFLYFFTLVFIPSLFYICHADETVPKEPELETDLKQEKVPLKTDDNVVQREEEQINPEGFSIAEKKLLEGKQESHRFEAEIGRLMGIIVNSLYSNRDVFLRELISNASDALDKIRYQSLTHGKEVLGDTTDLEIRIRADPETGYLHIKDTGVGMTREGLVENLGKIAQSGTRNWIEEMAKGGDIETQIGQFGVGFYSAFLVSDEVQVTSKHNDDKQHVWISQAETTHEYQIAEDPNGDTLGRGTIISLKLRDDAKEYLQQDKLEELVRTYSEFINFPIYVWSSEEIEEEVPVEEEDEEEEEGIEEEEEEAEEEEDELEVDEEEEEEEDDTPKTKTVKKTVWGWKQINTTKPLWTRSTSEITDEEYNAFYKSLTKDDTEPLRHVHFKAEGDVEFTALLYIPSEPPYSVFDGSATESDIKLYVRRVFIADTFKDIMPKYLAFIKGLVDSNTLPLNVSRETLQQHKSLNVIKKKIVRKAIAMFQKLADDPEEYEKFFKNYGTNLKWGLMEDTNNRTRLSKLLRYKTFKHQDKEIGLQQYVEEMQEGQKEIYFLGGESLESVKSSPLLERVTREGKDVVLMTEPIDEYSIQVLEKFDGEYKLVNLGKDQMKVDDEEKDQIKELEEEYKPLTDYMKSILSGEVEKVKVSTRLTKTPCALVSSSWGMSPNMMRIFGNQALTDERARKMYSYASGRKILEVNPNHPIVKDLLKRIEADDEDPVAEDIALVLFDTAVITSGFTIKEPLSFAGRVHKMLAVSMDMEPEELDFFADEAVEPEVPIVEEVETKEEL